MNMAVIEVDNLGGPFLYPLLRPRILHDRRGGGASGLRNHRADVSARFAVVGPARCGPIVLDRGAGRTAISTNRPLGSGLLGIPRHEPQGARSQGVDDLPIAALLHPVQMLT